MAGSNNPTDLRRLLQSSISDTLVGTSDLLGAVGNRNNLVPQLTAGTRAGSLLQTQLAGLSTPAVGASSLLSGTRDPLQSLALSTAAGIPQQSALDINSRLLAVAAVSQGVKRQL